MPGFARQIDAEFPGHFLGRGLLGGGFFSENGGRKHGGCQQRRQDAQG